MIQRKFTVTDTTDQSNLLTVSETTWPEAMSISIFDPLSQTTVEITISQDDWETLTTKLSSYSNNFTWTPKPAQPEVAL